MFEVRFPLNINWSEARATYETPYAATERPLDQHFCAQTFVDSSDGEKGVALFNRGTPGHWVRSGRMDMVLLRSFSDYQGYARGRKMLGLDWDDDDARCVLAKEHGDHFFHYSIYPHLGPWTESRVVGWAHSYNSPLVPYLASGVERGDRRMVSTSPDNFELVVLKSAGDDLIMRGYETHGASCRVRIELPFEPQKAWVSDILESVTHEVATLGREVLFGCDPHEIVTLRVQR
jgi:alpha-mannosidase